MSDRGNGFKRVQYNCPYRFKCDCYVAFSLKECADRYVSSQAGSHDLNSHIESKGILSVKQRGAVAERQTQSLKDCRTRGFCAVFPSSQYAAQDSPSSASEGTGS